MLDISIPGLTNYQRTVILKYGGSKEIQKVGSGTGVLLIVYFLKTVG